MDRNPDSQALARLAVGWGLEKKAEDPVLMDLTGIFDVTDYFVVMTATSDVQLRAVADHIDDEARRAGHRPFNVEGRDGGGWILLDFVDVVVHVMLPETRRRYLLERLWGDAPLTRFDETGEPVNAGAGGEGSA